VDDDQNPDGEMINARAHGVIIREGLFVRQAETPPHGGGG
jgi:hypothetical protein